MSAGPEHAVFVDRTGGIYAFGDSNNGKLCISTSTSSDGRSDSKRDGDGDGDDESKRTSNKGGKITSSLSFISAAAGSCHSVFATTTNVYTCGCNTKGQIGASSVSLSSNVYSLQSMSSLPSGSTIKGVSASKYNSYILYNNGDLYSSGSNEKGQLGYGSSITYSLTLRKAAVPEAVSSIATGDDHVLALTVSGLVYVWGSNCTRFV